MGDTLRLFTALVVPDQVKDEVARLTRRGLEGKWAHPDDLHITIRFLGDVAFSRLEAVKAALESVRRPPFHLSIRGMGVFENRRQSVLYANVESTRKLTALCTDMTDRLTPLGFDFGTRPYVPHMTLARLSPRIKPDKFIRQYGHLMAAQWPVNAFHLMRSAGSDGTGRRYQSLNEYRLL